MTMLSTSVIKMEPKNLNDSLDQSIRQSTPYCEGFVLPEDIRSENHMSTSSDVSSSSISSNGSLSLPSPTSSLSSSSPMSSSSNASTSSEDESSDDNETVRQPVSFRPYLTTVQNNWNNMFTTRHFLPISSCESWQLTNFNIAFPNVPVPVRPTPPPQEPLDYSVFPSTNRSSVSTSTKPVPPSKSPHPFSIDAILGKDNNSNTTSADACITSFCPPSGYSVDHMDNAKVYWCHVCETFCANAADAQWHQLGHASDGSKSALQRLYFQQHGHISTHERLTYMNRIKCGLCMKVIVASSFARHLSSHNGFICNICGHEFDRDYKLAEHINIHTGYKPFSCDICDRRFAKKASMKQHRRYHNEAPSVECEFCGKRFYRKCAYRVHVRIHTGYNPFPCNVPGCKKAFPQKIQLQLHINTHKKRGEI